MKASYLFAGLAMITTITRAQEKPFAIKGSITGKTNDYIYLMYSAGTETSYKTDSAFIKDGRFSFTGKLNGPIQAYVILDKNGNSFGKHSEVFINPGNMELSIDYKQFPGKVVLKGSPAQQELDVLTKAKAPVNKELKPLRESYDKLNNEYIAAIKAGKDSATLASLKNTANNAREAMEPYFEKLNAIDGDYMDKHPRSPVTASILRFRISGMPLPEAEKRYAALSDETKNSALGQAIKKEVDGLRKGSPGATAFQFASKEIKGEMLKLADYKGKYVLLDFWASWCVPCRKGNPHLLSLYSKYKDKGLEIIGISDDDSKPENWHKAVEKDKIDVWKHVLRGLKHGPNNTFDRSEDISEQYGIHSLPTKILIDPKGIIIGRYGGGGENDEAMDKKLAEIFSSKEKGDGISLHIGDAAPPITYSRWLKGTPVTNFSNDRLYVLEFWATWCGPCIAAMPHLSDLADKYKDKATFIGVNVYEKTGDKPYETALPNVTRFVNSSANRMRYDIIADNNAQDMGNGWLKAAGQGGIPTTFVIKKGMIVWIGHPIKLDSVMDPILAGTFDVAAFKKDFEEKQAKSSKSDGEMKAIFKAIKEATDANDYSKAFQQIDEGIKKIPFLNLVLKAEKFRIMLRHFPEAEALAFARELNKENRSFSSMIAMDLTDKDSLSKEAYLFAVESWKKALEDYKFSAIYDKLALAYSKAGETRLAIEAEEIAIAAAKEEAKDPKFGGRVFDYTITDYEQTLNKYKKEL